MSFLILANKLFRLTRSPCLHKILDGEFDIKVLKSPNTSPYHCHLSPESIQVALNLALAKSTSLPVGGDPNKWHKSFTKHLLGRPGAYEVDYNKPLVHAELSMVIVIDKGNIKNVLPHIGVSKLSCLMCDTYI